MKKEWFSFCVLRGFFRVYVCVRLLRQERRSRKEALRCSSRLHVRAMLRLPIWVRVASRWALRGWPSRSVDSGCEQQRKRLVDMERMVHATARGEQLNNCCPTLDVLAKPPAGETTCGEDWICRSCAFRHRRAGYTVTEGKYQNLTIWRFTGV